MNKRVLFVDDEEMMLKSFNRILRKQVEFTGVTSADKALMKMQIEDPYAVVVSDLQMPGMDGLEFLAEVKRRYPNTVRIMLTGNADLEIAMTAVNEGNIFRFLTKPVSQQALLGAIFAALEQYRLVISEKELLEKTLINSIEVLNEITSFVSPDVDSHSTRVQNYLAHILGQMNVQNKWEFKIAGLLSQIGLLSIPTELRRKILMNLQLTDNEKEIYYNHPIIGRKLIGKIPRLRNVAIMIGGQLKDFSSYSQKGKDNNVAIGAQALKVAIEFDKRLILSNDHKKVIKDMLSRDDLYNPEIVELLKGVTVQSPEFVVRKLPISKLSYFMEFYEDVVAKNGLVLIPKGKVVNRAVIESLRSFQNGIGVVEPIQVKIYS